MDDRALALVEGGGARTLRFGLAGAALALVVATVGCASSSAPGSPQVSEPVDDASVAAKAQAAIGAPGTRVAEVPSSLPGVSAWTAYLSDGVTVLGTDGSGRLKAAAVFEVDANGAPQAIVCTVSEELRTPCSALMTAIGSDLRAAAPGAVAARTIHPLSTPDDSGGACDACKTALGGMFQQSDQNIPPKLDPTPEARCVLADAPAQCVIFHNGVGRDEWGRSPGPETTGSVSQACCGAPLVSSNDGTTKTASVAALAEAVDLVVNDKKARLLCRDSEPVCR